MRRLSLYAACLLLGAVGSVSAQTTTTRGFAVVGPGTVSGGGGTTLHLAGGGGTTLHLAGGGEVLFKGVGPLFEVGFLGPTSYLSEGLGVFSLNGIYHVRAGRDSGNAVSPFVTAGYSMFFRDGHANFWNAGGGLDWWVGRKIGVRVELRDQIRHESYTSPYYSYSRTWHFWNVRTGIVFR